MKDWFMWNGRSCTEFGVHVSKHPSITLAKERVTYVEALGRPGSLALTQGNAVFDDVTLTCECFVTNMEKYDEFVSWVHGGGTVVFANRPEGYYEARIANQVPFDQIVRGRPNRTLKIQFRCKPFFHPFTADTPVELSSGSATALDNPYGFDAYPLIKVSGRASEINLMVNGYTVLIDDLDGDITLDCENYEAFRTVDDTIVSAGSQVSIVGDDGWPVLEAGSNSVNWSPTGGGITVTVTPRWRCL